MIAGGKSDNIHIVTERDPAFLFHHGEGFQRHKLPAGTSVIYPNRPVKPVADRRGAIAHALDNPLGCDPLGEQLKPGMKVTIAFDDVSLPLPPMKRPDIRQDIIELVLERLDKAGVTDIELICAICLHRRCTPRELKHFVGPKVFKRFFPQRLYNHDAEDPDGNVHLGKTETGEEVELNKRAVDSDLLIYVNINLVAMDGGHKSVPVGLATYKSVRHHHNAPMLLHESSYMDVANSAFHRSCERMGDVARDHLNIFTIETTLNGDAFHPLIAFAQKREHEWTLFDKLSCAQSSVGLKLLPSSIRRKAYSALPSQYGLVGVNAGKTDLVHPKTLDSVHDQHCVPIDEPFDIVLMGLPSIGPYNVDSILNPILVHCLGLGYFFNFYRNKPLVKKGGVVILLHPMENRFHMTHHPSYFDFFNECLPDTRDPHELEKRFEKKYAESERYIDLYRHGYAYHGVHPFYMWYWGAHGAAHVGKVVCVNPVSTLAAERLGYDIAPTLNRAIGMARDFAGQDAKMAYFHCPPILMCDLPA